MRIFQKGFNFSQDGPGNRLVYHVSGCNMRCPWCSNPEGMKKSESHREYTKEELAAEAKSCRMMFFDGGGVTFTGGEATLSPDLEDILQALQKEGIHTAIETNGTSEKLLSLLPYVDYLMMDFKHVDDETLKRYTGADGKVIRANYEAICRSGRQCHIRIPLIREFNGGCAEDFAAYLSSQDTKNVLFEFLPYHEYGREKWQEEYRITDGFVSEEEAAQWKAAFTKQGLKYIKT